MSARAPLEFFPALSAIDAIRHAFIQRIPGIDVSKDKAEALKALDLAHREARREIGMADWPLLTAQQIHGNKIAVVDLPLDRDQEFAGCDGLITNQREIALGIHVADCGAVYIVDPTTPAIGLVHSGKKGTEQAIAPNAIRQMHERFGSEPGNLIVQISPCIRPPHYEIDFAANIVEQCRTAGVKQIYAASECTACDTTRYYSYRAEKGKTGRMLALLGLR
ncbi:MAG TPA: polyphenol oxidase family protein [Chthoniobacterales bacterium]|nr:polyphenol oxidase family protein [Chthoniobacterales bacterium]